MYTKSLGSQNRWALKEKKKKAIPATITTISISPSEEILKDSKWEPNSWNPLKFHGQENGVTEQQWATPTASLPGPQPEAPLLSPSMVRRHLTGGAHNLQQTHCTLSVFSLCCGIIVSGCCVPEGSSLTSWQIISSPWLVAYLAVGTDEHFLSEVHLHGVGLQPGSLLLSQKGWFGDSLKNINMTHFRTGLP